ncbi:MAG: cytochrome c biogenesis protein CcsA [Desulfobacterales bacterium]|nr:cytochrome c biogenesis protein CcsA [Desulfobacterales bacterium]
MELTELLKYEVIFHWIALFFYMSSTVFFVWCVVFKREKILNIGSWVALIGLIPHSVALGVRWYAVGHGPYLQKAESLSSIAWVALVMFMAFSYKVPKLKSIGFVVLPCCLLMTGIGLFYNPEIHNVPPSFCGIWFIIHIISSDLAAGAILIAVGAAVLYLLKKKKGEAEFYRKLPSLELLDAYSCKFAGFGFILWGVMVASGALWADESWGRYWGWDPIETWSLITWLLFGIYLHLRKFFKWRGSRAAWLIIVCFIFSIATLFVIPFVMTTIHAEYLL